MDSGWKNTYAEGGNVDAPRRGESAEFTVHQTEKDRFPEGSRGTALSGSATTERSARVKYKCDVCGFIYDPKDGDPKSGVEPGTPFESIPDDWVCPACGAGKDEFSPTR